MSSKPKGVFEKDPLFVASSSTPEEKAFLLAPRSGPFQTLSKTWSLGLLLLFPASAATAAEKIDVEKALSLPTINLFDLDAKKGPPRKGGLLELKWRELRKEWRPCRDLAAKLQPTAKDLEGWVSRTRLECALRAFDERKEALPLGAAFDAVKPTLLREGPWRESLREAWIRAGLILSAKGQPPVEARHRADALMSHADLLSKDQRAEALTALGDAALAAKDDDQAIFFWRQSLDQAPSTSVQARVSDWESRHGGGTKKDGTRDDAAASAPETGAEAETDLEVQKALTENRREDAVRRMVETLNRFPSGKFAKRYRDRILDLIANADERDTEDAPRLRAAALGADPSRLAEWAGQLHRRLDDRGSMETAEKALETLSSSPQAAVLHYVAGRSASFLGDNERASRHFDQIIQFHSNFDDAPEALFRLGLIQVREGRWAAAVRLFDKLLANDRSKYDLNGRYWRARALEKTDAARFASERDELIRRFPFSYYGLRLRAERDGAVEFPKNERSPLEARAPHLWVAGAQKKAWDRLRRLSAEGWLLEAQAELAQMPMPQDPWSMLQWSRALAKWNQYPTSILLLNRAIEADESLRLPRYLDSGFPRSYSRWIDAEAKNNGLEPALVRALIRQESAFGLKAVSSSSAMGLMQLIPPTAREMADELRKNVEIPGDMFRPEVNVPMGTRYIAKMLREFDGTVPFALAAYNAGPHRLGRWLKGRASVEALKGKLFTSWQDEIWYDELPWSETSFYVKAILRNVILERLVDQGRVELPPAFWSDLGKKIAGPRTDDEVKRR